MGTNISRFEAIRNTIFKEIQACVKNCIQSSDNQLDIDFQISATMGVIQKILMKADAVSPLPSFAPVSTDFHLTVIKDPIKKTTMVFAGCDARRAVSIYRVAEGITKQDWVKKNYQVLSLAKVSMLEVASNVVTTPHVKENGIEMLNPSELINP